jgi:hypothetical protein
MVDGKAAAEAASVKPEPFPAAHRHVRSFVVSLFLLPSVAKKMHEIIGATEALLSEMFVDFFVGGKPFWMSLQKIADGAKYQHVQGFRSAARSANADITRFAKNSDVVRFVALRRVDAVDTDTHLAAACIQCASKVCSLEQSPKIFQRRYHVSFAATFLLSLH